MVVVVEAEGVEFHNLPEDCIANVLSLTTPRDVGRISLVSSTFRSAAESDAVWDRFLPSDYQSIISQSSSADNSSLCVRSKKQLYLNLCRQPLLIDDGKKSFQLEKLNGKKCYMLSARSLFIVWGDTPRYWRWISLPEARFPEVAELVDVCWLEIRGMINTIALSPNTQYSAYLVFKMINARGFHNRPVELSIGTVYGHSSTKIVCLDPNVEGRQHNRVEGLQRPSVRSDGWLEILMGEFFNSGLEDEEMQMSVTETRGGNWKSGLFLEGIEVRPKEDD